MRLSLLVSQLEHALGAQYRSTTEYYMGPISLNEDLFSTSDYYRSVEFFIGLKVAKPCLRIKHH